MVISNKVVKLLSDITTNINNHIRLVLFITVLVFTLILSACDYDYSLYHENIREETTVQKIELITYFTSTEEEESKNGAIILDVIEVIDILDEQDLDDFLDELSQIGGLSGKEKQVIDFPKGHGVRITYIDEGFTIITITQVDSIDSIFVGHYDSDAKPEYYYGISRQEMINDFIEIIEDYFQYEIITK